VFFNEKSSKTQHKPQKQIGESPCQKLFAICQKLFEKKKEKVHVPKKVEGGENLLLFVSFDFLSRFFFAVSLHEELKKRHHFVFKKNKKTHTQK
jgi:hypothetical protein